MYVDEGVQVALRMNLILVWKELAKACRTSCSTELRKGLV